MAMYGQGYVKQFTQPMKRQAAAHTDHLNEVLAAQQGELTQALEPAGIRGCSASAAESAYSGK